MRRLYVVRLCLAIAFAAIGLSLSDIASTREPLTAGDHLTIRAPVPNGPSDGRAPVDTVYVGYSSAAVDTLTSLGIDGTWTFDTPGITDSAQAWRFYTADFRFDATQGMWLPQERPYWYFDHGNEVNGGDQGLWEERDGAGRSYRRTGVIGVWHVDDMDGVPNSIPLAGSSSAWCGLREVHDTSVKDPVTGNAYNGSLSHNWRTEAATSRDLPNKRTYDRVQSGWPGYGDQWDQLLYHDINIIDDGSEQISFLYSTEMSDELPSEPMGTGWFNPDPTSIANLVLNPVDSLMVWIGVPKDFGVYDANRRWLSEVLDFDSIDQPVKLFSAYGNNPISSSGLIGFPQVTQAGGFQTIRVVFQVKTNRTGSDEYTVEGGFNSSRGAAMIDNVAFTQAGELWDFESTSDIRARRFSLFFTNDPWVEISPSSHWVTTGKPPSTYGHVEDVLSLSYDDDCGWFGSPDRQCNLEGNVLVLSNHDDPQHRHAEETWNMAVSPTINVAPRSPIRDEIGYDGVMRVQYDLYSGNMDLDAAVFYSVGCRFYSTRMTQAVPPYRPAWSGHVMPKAINYVAGPLCGTFSTGPELDTLLPPLEDIDSLQISIGVMTRCNRFGSSIGGDCGRADGVYFDNIRACFVADRTVPTANSWDLLQDAFPFSDPLSGGPAPGSPAFDTTTALMKTAVNHAGSQSMDGVIPGDSLVFASSYFGDDTRMDLVFRILPGPGNYSDPGNTNSPLLRVPSDPGAGTASPGDGTFFGQYLESPGLLGKGLHFGSIWNSATWNVARMDSVDNQNLYPIVPRGLGMPLEGYWRGTLHEEDRNFSALGIQHDLCFLIDPAGPVTSNNVCCSTAECGSLAESYPPSAYGVVPTQTMEGTKILPDGLFTPGTHIEYFARRSSADGPTAYVTLTPDTNVAAVQRGLGPNYDAFRWLEVGVLPDMWKDVRYGGQGLACMLIVDAGDGRGAEGAMVGALDTLVCGKNNGAGRGWKAISHLNPDPNDPAARVYENLGQKGLTYDWFDAGGSGSLEGGRLGSRVAIVSPAVQDKQATYGPTPEVLKHYYDVVLWMTGDVLLGTLHDQMSAQEQSGDVHLMNDYFISSFPGNENATWLMGDHIAQDLESSMGFAPLLLNNEFAVSLDNDNYRRSFQQHGARCGGRKHQWRLPTADRPGILESVRARFRCNQRE